MRDIKKLLLQEEGLSVSRCDRLLLDCQSGIERRRNIISSYFSIYEQGLVRQRRSDRFRRKRFWDAGVMDMICIDQHDKWKYKYGLALHTGVDPFVGESHWLKVWWTDSNPKLIAGYYLDSIEATGCELSSHAQLMEIGDIADVHYRH
jgi:hypothetical protein